MGFLAPFMLAGALAAGIPVAIHFFFRSRYRTVPWAAMKFLLSAVEQTSRRLKFQELLLLLLRMAVLIMLAIAFARPMSSGVRGVGRGDAVDAVFVFDTSYSMGAPDGEMTRFERARAEAVKIIDELPAHSTVQIVTCAGKSVNVVGPRSPANLDQARQLVQALDLTHLTTDLTGGTMEARSILERGQSSNKEFYVFSDMQKMGFEQQADKLKAALHDIKEKAIVHMVHCGSDKFKLKNALIENIAPQAGVPRPGERVDFAVLVRNTSAETMKNIRVSLEVDGDEKNGSNSEIPYLPSRDTQAVTLTGKLGKPGLHVLTAKIGHDDLPGDNRFDQVIHVRDQVNILVVDGNYNERDAEKSSSFHLMHSLVPVKDMERATYKYNPRVVPARLASKERLDGQDICILVNCSVQARLGLRAETLSGPFLEALEKFVKSGHGLIVFTGDNVLPDEYNRLLDKKHGLLPMPIKPTIKAEKVPFFMSRDSFAQGPPSYWKFKDDKRYEVFDAVPVWQHHDVDESAIAKPKKDVEPEKEPAKARVDGPVQVIARLTTGKALVVSKQVEKGEVIFIGTAAQHEGSDPVTGIPTWTIFNRLPPYVPFLDVTLAHLMNGQTQAFNLVAGQTLTFPADKLENVYNLIPPSGPAAGLGVPEKKADKRYVVTASDFARGGIYRMTSVPLKVEAGDTPEAREALKNAVPIALTPDPRESDDLTVWNAGQIDSALGFKDKEIIHIAAGTASATSLADRMNREWTVWALLAVLILVLVEVAFAWWCGRAW